MSIVLYIAHTGQRLRLDPGVNSTLEAVRSWTASHTNIQPRSQILLTAQGKQVRAQTLLTENEVFVFDSSWLDGRKAASPAAELSGGAGHGSVDGGGADHGSTGITGITGFTDFTPGPAPDTITAPNDLASWQGLFGLRRNWAADLLAGCSLRARHAQQHQSEQAVIERCLGVAVASLQQHIKSAEKQYAAVDSWAAEQLQDQQAHADNWDRNLDSLRSVPARHDFTRFIPPMAPASGARRHSQQHISTLQGYVDVVTVKQAASAAKSYMNALASKLDKMRDALDSASTRSNELLQAVDQINSESFADPASEPAQLIEEIDMVVKKMASDLEHVQSLPETSHACAQASKMALLHTRSYLPNLNDYCSEMNDLAQRMKRKRDGAADVALGHMRTLSAIESQLAKLYQDIKEIDMSDDQQAPFVALSIVSRLPSVYGHLLVESVRRREWVAKMRRDCMTLQEEFARYQQEEEKRRKKWMRNVDDLVSSDALQSRVLGVELNLQNEGGSWPMVTREELDEYVRVLLELFGAGPVTDEIDMAVKDLDRPARKQVKHARAFKNGSMHEAAFGDKSLLLRGHDANKALQDTNARLEEEVRAQKSRVRKLEDLLHRQTQVNRVSAGDLFTPTGEGTASHRASSPTTPLGTPQLPGSSSCRGSMNQQRRGPLAPVQSTEEKRLAKRVLDLEAELQVHVDEAVTRKSSDAEIQKQVEEAISTKKDLMENMDAQQREFATVRRNLEKELRDAKERIEEAENEVERLMGSRDGIDEEVARLKEDASGHAARAATEHDARGILERKLEQAEAARRNAEEELQRLRAEQEKQREADTEHLHTLTTAHAHLSPDAEVPSGLPGLASALEQLTRRAAAHAKELEDAIAFAKSENESLWSSNERQKNELAAATQRQTDAEDEIRQAQEKLSSEEARGKVLQEQLNEEQQQLRSLRDKFADGETGSEVLRQRVAEEEERCAKLRTELAEAKSHTTSLDVELMRLQKKHKVYQVNADASSERLQKRAERAKEISQKLYSQNLRLGRLLERLGLLVAYQGEAMTVERASKIGASTTMVDPSMHMSRPAPMSSPPPARKPSNADHEPATDLRLLHWPDAQTAEEETSQYEAFLNHVSRFDLDVFSDAVAKRVKDFEYTAKKYSKESKESTKRADAYKERALKLRSEAHGKIAVRDFKEGDMALFLPTRGGQVKGAWAAFNIGCPHYFLAERDGMRLGTRDFIVARIQKVEQKVVDLRGQRAAAQTAADGRNIDETRDAPSPVQVEDDNPFDLSDGLTWWMVHAVEERGAGAAPTTPGLGKSTVSTAAVDAKGSIRIKRSSKEDDASKHLNKSLDSRRSSSNSKKGMPSTGAAGSASATPRKRSESQASSLNQQQLGHEQPGPVQPRPPPAPAGSGVGSAPEPYEQIRPLSTPGRRPASSRRQSASPSTGRSKSPRTSAACVETPRKPAREPSGWKSLWSAEFSVHSPSPEKKKLDWG